MYLFKLNVQKPRNFSNIFPDKLFPIVIYKCICIYFISIFFIDIDLGFKYIFKISLKLFNVSFNLNTVVIRKYKSEKIIKAHYYLNIYENNTFQKLQL